MSTRGLGVLAAVAALLLGAVCWGAELSVTLDGRQAETRESTLGDLVADALQAAAEAQVALLNASQLRPVVIPAGPVSAEQVQEALFYPQDKVVRVTLTGEQLRAALERSVLVAPQPNKGFLQVSGLAYRFRSDLPANSRVTEVLVEGRPLVATAKYRVALPQSLAKGALGYFRVFNELNIEAERGTLADAVASYLAGQKAISLKGVPRILDLARPPAG